MSLAALACFAVLAGCGSDTSGGSGCTSDEDCSDRGTCVVDGTCQCDPGYAGEICDECDAGYTQDGSDLNCVSETFYCGADGDCGHGICDITGTCRCDEGWDGQLCDECDTAHGYIDNGGNCVIACPDEDGDGHEAYDASLCPTGDDFCDFDPDAWDIDDCDWCPGDPHNHTEFGCANCVDNDGDGYGVNCDLGPDCDDAVPTTHASALEICGDGVDNDCDGIADQATACPSGIGTYVSALYGNDATGLGTQQSPVQTIGMGIANAITIGGGHPVYVAEGNYNEKVILVEGISLLGGHQCDTTTCTWARDPVTYVATIQNTDRQGVFADITISNITEISGFTIAGVDTNSNGTWQTPGTAAVTVSGGTPVIRNNEILAGSEGSCSTWNECGSFGVRILGPTNDPASGVLLDGNEIYGGSSISFGCSAVALVRNPTPIATVIGNWIKGGDCGWNRAVDAWSSGYGTLFEDNDIFAGTSTGSGGSSFAIIVSGYATINANRINHDPAEMGDCPNPNTNFWCGGIEAEGATAWITNNVVFGMESPRSVAVFMGDGEVPFGLVHLNANTLVGSPTSSSMIAINRSAAIACRTSQGVNAKVGRIANNILLGGAGTNRFGMYEMDQQNARTCEPILYENNDIYFAPMGGTTDNAHRQWTGAGQQVLLQAVTDVNNQSYATGNFSVDPMLSATNHLLPGSPCVDAGTFTDAPLTDMDGEIRPQGNGIDVGADEAG
ncbi:MAG: choice-of-anchor Q domain-containing protein [bacterium]